MLKLHLTCNSIVSLGIRAASIKSILVEDKDNAIIGLEFGVVVRVKLTNGKVSVKPFFESSLSMMAR